MKVRHIFIILIFFISCNTVNDKKKKSEQDSATNKTENQKYDSFVAQFDTLYSFIDSTVIVKGIIQSSGIQGSDNFDIEAKFQITNPKKSFFLVTKQDLSPYWGKCVSVTGRYVKGWDSDSIKSKGSYKYSRSAIYLNSIKDISNEYCFNSPVFVPIKKIDFETTKEDTIVKGFIVRSLRMAPDINYDYSLVLEKPIHNLDNPSDKISSITLQLNMQLDSLNYAIENRKRVTLYGNFINGYAETTVFNCKKEIKIE